MHQTCNGCWCCTIHSVLAKQQRLCWTVPGCGHFCTRCRQRSWGRPGQPGWSCKGSRSAAGKGAIKAGAGLVCVQGIVLGLQQHAVLLSIAFKASNHACSLHHTHAHRHTHTHAAHCRWQLWGKSCATHSSVSAGGTAGATCMDSKAGLHCFCGHTFLHSHDCKGRVMAYRQ